MTIRLEEYTRALNALTPFFSFIFVSSEEIGTVDPQGPWEYLDHWFFHVQGAAGECTVRDRPEPSDLGLNNRRSLDLSRVARGLKPHA
jgi:hypothetical protein